MGGPEIRGRSHEDEKNEHLSASSGTPRIDSSHHRSASPVPSFRTTIEENPEFVCTNAAIKRRRTQVAVVKLSWWDCFKGFLLGPKQLKRKLAATVRMADLEDADVDMFDHKECPFVLTVSVFPCVSSGVEQAKCVFDTACLQGNIISSAFARRLGYKEFQDLKSREEPGGTVATGQIHKVKGAVHVSWFHSTSPQVFRDMRFLVSESAQVDLVIGTHSIVRHQLISPPNLLIEFTPDADPDREKLAGKAANLQTELEDLKDDRKSKGEDKKLDGKIKKKEREYNLAIAKLDMYNTKAASKGRPTERTKEILLDLQRQIDTLEAESKKHAHKKKADKRDAEKPAQEIPDIKVRTATGLSAASTTGEVRNRK